MKFFIVLIISLICVTGCEDHKVESLKENENQTNVEIQTEETTVEVVNKPYYFEGDIIHGLTINDTNVYEEMNVDSEVIATVSSKQNLDILSFEDEYYKVKYKETEGYTKKEDIKFFVFDKASDYTLACDVSGFNYKREFFTKEDFEKYLLDYNFNYAIIRLGGRGYGQAGNMYYDEKVSIFVDACEYLGVPYGFYFLDEALNEEEVHAEYKFALEKYNEYKGKFHLLPLSIDMENQHGDGRADNNWDERVALVNLLIDDFKKSNIDCMLYANGARIETYLKDVNCNYWTAAYTLDNKIPQTFYDEFIKIEEQKNKDDENNITDSILNTKVNLGDTETIWYSDKYLDKVVAWQFTETAASLDGITGTLDLNLMKNNYFVNICGNLYD